MYTPFYKPLLFECFKIGLVLASSEYFISITFCMFVSSPETPCPVDDSQITCYLKIVDASTNDPNVTHKRHDPMEF